MRRLLIVDDDAAMRRLFRLNLADNYDIVDTDDPEQVLALAMEHKPDAILMDLRMPKFSGFELCRAFHSFSKTQSIPIFVVSGETGNEAKQFCRDLGAAGYFEKPIDFEALNACLARVKRQCFVPRSEVRVQLRVPLKLRGTDIHGNTFEETTSTENVSLSGFLCGCTAALQKESLVDVYIVNNAERYVGKARTVRAESLEPSCARYGFRFVEKVSEWILQ
jgi:DNA-binding response OmpR family regulator